MKKTKTIEYRICDFCLKEGKEALAVDQVQPSGKDVCEKHRNDFTIKVKFPEEFGSEVSEKSVIVEPDYDAQMVVKYTKKDEIGKN